MAKVYYDNDASLKFLIGKKISVIGYGSQGRAQALNMRDSGLDVVIGLREGGKSWGEAIKDGFKTLSIKEAASIGDVIMMLIPDVPMPTVFNKEIVGELNNGKTLVFAHGYNVHFKRIIPPDFVDVILVAPKSPGALLRQKYLEGKGVPSLIAVYQDRSGMARQKALAIAKAIGSTRAGVIETTFEEETETDLLGEQAVLVGGVMELIKKGFEVLIENGYQPELAYYEVCNELKLIVDLIYAGGLTNMLRGVSDTAKFGGLLVGPKIVDDHVKENMKTALEQIKSGEFEKSWTGNPNTYQDLEKMMAQIESHPLEKVGKELRRLALI